MMHSVFFWAMMLVVMSCRTTRCWALSSPATTTPLDDMEELTNLVVRLKGDDTRLFRWDVTEHTSQRQLQGDCDKLEAAAAWLVNNHNEDDDDDDDDDDDANNKQQVLVMDYLTLCITNHPQNRATFSNVPGIHEAVVHLVSSSSAAAAALACHLIYIATYTNERNHQTFYQQGAVPALANLFMNENSNALQRMWAASALQNLAASYCETINDGTCHWEWTSSKEHVQLAADSPLYSDATAIRQQMIQIDGLVDTLIEWACQDPILLPDVIEEQQEHGIVMPGSTAVAGGQHDDEESIVTWAAMGTLKNLALEPTAKSMLEGTALRCACFLKDSHDWLEGLKSFDFIYFMRRSADPCWMLDDDSALCVDGNFLDQGMYQCEDYDHATDEECENNVDIFTGQTAAKMCCGCGGGAVYERSEANDEL